MPQIEYCDATIFLTEHLPAELCWRTQNLSAGGQRVLLYWHASIQQNKDGSPRFFAEFGREYLGQHNTNQPHAKYIELVLNRLHTSLKKLGRKPSFVVTEVMAAIPWKRKEKPSLTRMHYSP